jgi:tRNA threonylcarbamoyladenosine modification (KEOPS) complex Cgi121 subunit
MAERQILQDAISIGGIHDGALAKAAAVLGFFALQQMAFAGVAAQDFARAGDLESLGHGLSCFDAFGSSHKFLFQLQKGAHYTQWMPAMQARFSTVGLVLA